MISFRNLVKAGDRIADLGCGPNGSVWWNEIDSSCRIEAFDLFNKPAKFPPNVTFHRKDVSTLHKEDSFSNYFNFVVADHIFEHVKYPALLAKSISKILKVHGLVHVGIPDADNFTDRFYRLIHRDGGGHIAQFNKNTFIDLMSAHGFTLLDTYPWPDGWEWLDRCYDLNYYGIEHATKEDIQFIANVFRKELTVEKGYLYGWEFLFRKDSSNEAFESANECTEPQLNTSGEKDRGSNACAIQEQSHEELVSEINILNERCIQAERMLDTIYSSNFWKVASFYYRMRDKNKLLQFLYQQINKLRATTRR